LNRRGIFSEESKLLQLTDVLGIFAPEPTNGFERQFVGFEIAHERAAEK
jgi:hypothetical protein